jgi:hypothetical protein
MRLRFFAVLGLLLCAGCAGVILWTQPPQNAWFASSFRATIGSPTNESPPVIGSTIKPSMPNHSLPTQAAPFTWPTWAQRARIAGAYFHPSESEATIDARLDALAAQQVSVIIADTPWGEDYATWVDDDKFIPVRELVARVVEKAHARGLKVVLYHVGLELVSPRQRNPGLEHPDWLQQSIHGQPVLYNDVSNEEEHWLHDGMWDAWFSPCDAGAGSFREMAFARVSAMTTTGIDGLWVDQTYLQSSVGGHWDLWPSTDPCSAAAFTAATGLPMPASADWDDPTFHRWVVWRHEQIAEFLLAEKAVARAVNPQLVFLNENANVDSGRTTYTANDPTAYRPYDDITTGHEVETIADRMDHGETGMKAATLDQWLAFRTMIAFARGVDVGKPSWILTYGYEPRDSAQLAGLVLAEGANFYETKGPQMADTVGENFRQQLFGWITEHESSFYDGELAGEVGLLYSPRTRDLLDTGSGEPYEVGDAIHFAAYRAAANVLHRGHIPFRVVIDTDIEQFAHFRVLVVPEVQAMGDATLAALRDFRGKVITIGSVAQYDEWMAARAPDPLLDLPTTHFPMVADELAAAADTGQLRTDAPVSLQFGLRQSSAGYAVVMVNTAATPTPATSLTLRLNGAERITAARFTRLSSPDVLELPFRLGDDDATVELTLPAGIETVALLTLLYSYI